MTKPNYSHIVAVLDRSGSMKKIEQDTIGGFNTFLDEQRKVPGEATLTLVQFNDKVEMTYVDVPLKHVANLTTETYRPSGWTALQDALARTINEVGRSLASKPEHERPSKVIVLVMTDGEENSSIEYYGTYGMNKLKHMIEHQTTKYSWDFVFIGSNIDSFATAHQYGILINNTINYTSDATGSYNAFKSLSRGTAAGRVSASTGVPMTLGFFENEASKSFVANDTIDTSDISETIKKYMVTDNTNTNTSNVTDSGQDTKTTDSTNNG